MKTLVRCKACGYIMEADKVGQFCPACGVPAKQLEPFDDKLSDRRRTLLSLDIHPVIVHAPEALSAILVVLCAVLFIPLGTIGAKLRDATEVLAVILPFTGLAAIASGIFDGKLRFRSLKPLLLRRKIFLGLAFLALSTAGAIFTAREGLDSAGSVAILLVITVAALGAGAVLGLIGSRLLVAKFPG